MKSLFNKSFFRFTMGFISILLFSFALAALVSHFDGVSELSAKVFGSV